MDRGEDLIFILGKPRSGTTWLLSALEHHPQCRALTPADLGIQVGGPTKETGLFVRGLSDETIAARVAAARGDGRRLVEKTPAHLLEAERIRRLFPGAKLVLIRREPFDVVYSLVQKNEFWPTCPKTLPDAMDLYLRYERAEPRAAAAADCRVNYEDLWRDPVGELTRLCAALGLAAEPVPRLVAATRAGRSLPAALKGVFREGTPGQGRSRFGEAQAAYVEARLDEAREPVLPGVANGALAPAGAPGAPHAPGAPGAPAAPLRLLLGTNHLFGYTGSELTALTLARQLQSLGQRVTVWARHVHPAFAARAAAGLTVVERLDGLDLAAFDAAYVQHLLGALELRHRAPRLPLLHAHLGVLPFLEQPAFLDLGVHRHLAISEEVRDNLIARGVPPARIAFLRNVVDSERFRPLGPPAEPPRRALLYSYKAGAERAELIAKACATRGLSCDWIGRRPGEVDQAELPGRLAGADLVFALGRGAIEAMMCGRVPFVFDCHGGDGAVTPENIDAIARCNFSGRLHRREYDQAALAGELAAVRVADGAALRALACERFDARRGAARLLGMLAQAAVAARERAPAPAPAALGPVVQALAEARSYAEQAAALRRAGPDGALEAAPSTSAAGGARQPGVPGAAPVAAGVEAAAAAEAEAEAGAEVDGPPGGSARVLAFYLPQFHPIPENDAWWGPGFTEWTSVARGRPAFPGHDQPRLPGELGFYDLRLPEVMEAQAELARSHGVDGFCFYHYWFQGRRLLEAPVERLLVSGRPDLPFCLCWANESWTRAWDGRSDEVLIAQEYSEDDDRAHLRDLLRFFADPRYVRVQGRPLFLVYRPSRLPDPRRTAEAWREEAARAGLPGLHLCGVESFFEDRAGPEAYGFDAAVEFQPDWANLGEPLAHPAFGRHRVYDYGAFVAAQLAKPDAPYRRYPCVTPRWDNTARRPDDSLILFNADPEAYVRWLAAALRGRRSRPRDERLVFVNAWNEWGEGCHLEPDLVAGRLWLEATRRAVAAAAAEERAALARVCRFGDGFRAGPRGTRLLGPEGAVRVARDAAGGADGVRLMITCGALAAYGASPPRLEVWAGGRKAGELPFDADHQTRELLLRVQPHRDAAQVTLRASACLRQRADDGLPLAFLVAGEPLASEPERVLA